jgi:hypothetical protein
VRGWPDRIGRPLLTVKANGERYLIATVEPQGELWFMSQASDGTGGGGPLGDPSGASSEPFEHFVFAGRLPPGARRAEIDAAGIVTWAKCRSGLSLAAVPWGGGELDGLVRYLDRADTVVSESRLHQPAAPGGT